MLPNKLVLLLLTMEEVDLKPVKFLILSSWEWVVIVTSQL